MPKRLEVKSGTRLQVAYDVPFGKEPSFDLVCTFKKDLDETAFLVSIPMVGGKSLEVSEVQKLLIRSGAGSDATIVAGYVDDVVQDGIHRYWKIRRVTELRQFYQRADERYKAALRLTYMQDTWPLNYDGKIVPEDGLSIDISNGGMAFYMSHHLEVGEVCRVNLPRLGADTPEVENIIGVVCWQREAPKGSPFKRVTGLQFRFAQASHREAYVRYVDQVKKKFALQ